MNKLSKLILQLIFYRSDNYTVGKIASKSLIHILLLIIPFQMFGQAYQLKGKITDKSTGLPLSHVTVGLEGKSTVALSDHHGHYKLNLEAGTVNVYYSALGYKKELKVLAAGKSYEVDMEMEPQFKELAEVSISNAKKAKYRNANNPAVDFMRQVIIHKSENSALQYKELNYEQYEKINMSLSVNSDQAKSSKLLKKLPFLLKNSDTIKIPGKNLIPVFMQEKLTHYMVSETRGDSTSILGEKQSRIDQYLDEDGITEYLEKIYQRADIYDNNIGMGSQQFLSPISALAPTFYKFFILDTLKDVTPHQLKIMIAPRNKEDVLFLGYLYVTLDGRYAVKRAELSINSRINLNWVRDLQITLDYQNDGTGRYYLEKSVMGMDLGVFKKGTSVFGEKTILINKFSFGEAALSKNTVHNGKLEPVVKTSSAEDNLERLRPLELSVNDNLAYTNIDSLKNSKPFRRKMAVASFLLSGYIPLGKIEIGPFSSQYSFNPIEGARFKLGARTTDEFSKKIFFDGHLAYGTRDQRWKYSLGAVYSLTGRSIYQFPVRSLTLRNSYETQIPGQDLNFLEDDNFLLSFKRGANNKWLYNKKWLLEYLHETESHFSFRIGYKNQVINPAGGLSFQTEEPSLRINELTSSEFTAEIRWAPNEKFYQGKRFRRPIINGYPIFTLRGSVGVKGFLNGEYDYQNIALNISKRFYLSILGYSDVIFESGAVFGKVPYPLLHIHRANQSYAYQLSSYNLMNFMEFMSDRYASLNIQHSFNGLFFNKIPLIKKLQWREVASFKILTGTITSENDPGKNPDLYRFPLDHKGLFRAGPVGRTPYIEGSVGISNIFKFLRVDMVRRFTHLNQPGVAKWGVRARINIDF